MGNAKSVQSPKSGGAAPAPATAPVQARPPAPKFMFKIQFTDLSTTRIYTTTATIVEEAERSATMRSAYYGSPIQVTSISVED